MNTEVDPLSINPELRIAIPTPTSRDWDYNRRSWPMYAAAVQDAGGSPIEVDLSLPEREIVNLAQGCDGVLLPGSPADVDPRRYGHEPIAACAPADLPREAADRLLLEEAYRTGKPVLGICYGVQSLNVWRGGTLIQDLDCVPVNHAAGASVAVAHFASIKRVGILSGILEKSEGAVVRIPVNSSHHQAIARMGDGLRVCAISAEDGIVEAVEAVDEAGSPMFVLGVQWHPERSVGISPVAREIFRAFLRAAASSKQLHQPSGRGINSASS